MKRAAVAALLTGIIACEPAEERPAQPPPPQPPTDSARAWSVRPTKGYLTCSPAQIGPDDALVLRMQRPHGSSLHVGAPDGTTYLVVFHGEGQRDRAARKSLMTPAAFEQLTELRLGVRTLMGGPWVFGRDTNEAVFQMPGAYRVRVGNDMETDGPNYAECLVTYRPR